MRNTKTISARGNYAKATQYMRNTPFYSKESIIKFYVDKLGVDYDVAVYSAKILLSPRLTSKFGDCRGSTSNPWGHLAYNRKLERKQVYNAKTEKIEWTEQKFRFEYRDTPLAPRPYPYQVKMVEQERTRVKAKAKSKLKKEVAI